jgi:hypothetical protein
VESAGERRLALAMNDAPGLGVDLNGLRSSSDSSLTGASCAGSLPAREAQFVLKYFLLRKAERGWQHMPLGN